MRSLSARPQGPACIENCPADVLTLATPAVLDNLAKSRRQRTAWLEAQPWGECTAPNAPPKLQQMQALAPRRAGFSLKHAPAILTKSTRGQNRHREASRCLKCGEHSICEWTCPLHNHIRSGLNVNGDITGAVALSHQTNCLPEITGRVCPQDRLCEGACTVRDESGAVTIGNIERYISDRWRWAGLRT
jgi:NAD-dependent dihydropyrimidine dehydrogenase PreA subunit